MEILLILMVLSIFAIGIIVSVMLVLDVIFKSNTTAEMCGSVVKFFRNVEEIK